MNPFKHFNQIRLVDVDLPLDQQLQADKTLSLTLQPNELIFRMWCSSGVILGKMDSILPDFQKGLDFLHASHIESYVRKAGGLAVVCDEGILNLTLIFSKDHSVIGGLNEAYAFGIEIQKALLSELNLNIKSGEISASYCPGTYDLSVNSQKFSGMAQYRSKEAVMVMITWCVSGDQKARCELIKAFYDMANPQHNPKYPLIDPASMVTLSDLTALEISVDTLKQKITSVLQRSETSVTLQKQL